MQRHTQLDHVIHPFICRHSLYGDPLGQYSSSYYLVFSPFSLNPLLILPPPQHQWPPSCGRIYL